MPSSRRVDPPVVVTVTTAAPWPDGDWSGLLSYWRRDVDTRRGFVLVVEHGPPLAGNTEAAGQRQHRSRW